MLEKLKNGRIHGEQKHTFFAAIFPLLVSLVPKKTIWLKFSIDKDP